MNKKMMSAAFGAALILMMSSLSVYAGGPDGETDRSVKWKERMEARKQEMFNELNLTDEQKQKLEENRKKNKDEAQGLRGHIKELKTAMRQELEKDTLDMGKINQIQSQMKEAQAQMMDNRLKGILEVRGILTPEQFKKFSAKMEEHKGRSMKMRWDKAGDAQMPSDGGAEMAPPTGSSSEAGQ